MNQGFDMTSAEKQWQLPNLKNSLVNPKHLHWFISEQMTTSENHFPEWDYKTNV